MIVIIVLPGLPLKKKKKKTYKEEEEEEERTREQVDWLKA
jgi:hypothetical protein